MPDCRHYLSRGSARRSHAAAANRCCKACAVAVALQGIDADARPNCDRFTLFCCVRSRCPVAALGAEIRWLLEQAGPLPFAASYLFYGQQFGSLDSGLWDFIEQQLASGVPPWPPADDFLEAASRHAIPTGASMPTKVAARLSVASLASRRTGRAEARLTVAAASVSSAWTGTSSDRRNRKSRRVGSAGRSPEQCAI